MFEYSLGKKNTYAQRHEQFEWSGKVENPSEL